MSDPRNLPRIPGPCSRLRLFLLGLVLSLLAAGPALAAGEKPAPPAAERHTVVGKNASAAGVLLVREAQNKPWHVVKPQAALSSAEELMALPGSRAEVDVKDGAVRLTLLGNVPELSPFPVLESVVRLHASPEMDLDVSLDRGRVSVTNRKARGAAAVRVRFQGQAYTWKLNDPGTSVAVELFSRWPRGLPFSKKPAPDDRPTTSVDCFVLAGQADLKAGSEQYSLHAPPGPALFDWDSIRGGAAGPSRQDKVPPWAESSVPSPDVKAVQEAVGHLRMRLEEKPVTPVLSEAINGADSVTRALAVFGLAAIDDLPRLIDALGNAKHADVRATAVLALRHWIGRGPDQDLKLYNALIKQRKYTEPQAEIVLQLLHSFSADDLERPETYETLIAYLRAGKLSIRELARWHLYRTVPSGKTIPYDPAGSDGEQARAFQAWKKLIPEGKLPPRPEPKND